MVVGGGLVPKHPASMHPAPKHPTAHHEPDTLCMGGGVAYMQGTCPSVSSEKWGCHASPSAIQNLTTQRSPKPPSS